VAPPTDIDELSPSELKQLVLALFEENAEQKRLIAELREEVARLKGLKGRSPIKPSEMEKGTTPNDAGTRGRHRGVGKTTLRVSVGDEILKADVPAGAHRSGPGAAGPGGPLSP